jgi:caffeoyl-CoA O-methyltransferase
VGSFAGYGAICIARGMRPGGTLHVIEANEEYEAIIRSHAQMAEVSDLIQLHIGQALDILPTLPNNIDLAFIDADKTNYEHYYNIILPKMRPGGLIIFDNMLWYGRVVEEPETQLRCDRSTRIIQHLNDTLTSDPRIQNILLPLRDGLMICRVKG